VGLQVEAVLAGEDEIPLEELLLGVRDVVALIVQVLHGESEVDHLYLMEEVLMVAHRFWHSYQDVVQLDVVEGVARLVDKSDLIKKLEANLVAAAWGEGFVTGE
jgi:hypothetical protein